MDDFKIIAKYPMNWMKMVQAKFLVKTIEDPKYYHGNNYVFNTVQKYWKVGLTSYIKEYLAKDKHMMPP